MSYKHKLLRVQKIAKHVESIFVNGMQLNIFRVHELPRENLTFLWIYFSMKIVKSYNFKIAMFFKKS